jgi:hypothetical protein
MREQLEWDDMRYFWVEASRAALYSDCGARGSGMCGPGLPKFVSGSWVLGVFRGALCSGWVSFVMMCSN